MHRVQDDDTGAFGQLFDRHVVRALRVASAASRNTSRVEDTVQEGFLSIWRSRAAFQPELGSFQGWSMGIIRNRAIDANRREAAGHRPQLAEADGDSVPERSAASLEDEVVARSEGAALRASLALLPEAQAEVIALAFFGELTHTEIAEQLALPEGTVKGRMRLGLERLRSQIGASA